MNRMTVNAEIIANGPVHANGPVYVMGMDIKAEIEKIKADLETIKKCKPEEIENVIKELIEKEGLIGKEEKSKLRAAFDTAIQMTDWAQRVQFWYNTIKLISDPFLLYLILKLLKLYSS